MEKRPVNFPKRPPAFALFAPWAGDWRAKNILSLFFRERFDRSFGAQFERNRKIDYDGDSRANIFLDCVMQNKTKIKVVVGIIILVVLGIFVNYIFSEVVSIHGNLIKYVYVRDVLVKAEVAASEEKRTLGLGGRKNLPQGRGMLFEWEDSDSRSFWMKGMLFPIDIIWIENGRVIGCEKNISPSDQRIFTSPSDAGYVLEVPAGFCDENSVKMNDEVKL